MKRPWAFLCTNRGTSAETLRKLCRKVYLLGYEPICPDLTYPQFLELSDPDERAAYEEFVRDKLLRSPLLVLCSSEPDARASGQVGLAAKYSRICTTLEGLAKAVECGDGFEN